MQTCRPAKCIEAIRVVSIDQCTFEPICGVGVAYAMGCIIEPDWSPEIEEGEESIVKDNCGNICLRDDRCDLTKRWNVEFKIKQPDPEFESLVTGNPLVLDGEGNSVGVRELSYGACQPYVYLELFERTDGCDGAGDAVYLRHVFPAVRLRWTSNEREGVFRVLMFEGKSRDVITDSIGIGPFGDIPAGLIVGATADERIDYVWFEDDTVPAVQCGAIDIVCCPIEYDCVTDTLTYTSPGPDVSGVVTIQLNGTNIITQPPHFTSNATTITIPTASVFVPGQFLNTIEFFDPAVNDCLALNIDVTPCP